MIRRFKKKEPRVDPDELSKKAEQSLRETSKNQEHVNYLTTWLERRQNQNGFGEDFEYTLRPRRAR